MEEKTKDHDGITIKLRRENSQMEDNEEQEDDEDFDGIAFPAISPISNISSSSGKLLNKNFNLHNSLVHIFNRFYIMWVNVFFKTNNTYPIKQ